MTEKQALTNTHTATTVDKVTEFVNMDVVNV